MKTDFKPFMLIPALVLLAAFGLDKSFYINHIQDSFLRTASFLNYDHKDELIDVLEDYLKKPNRKKVMVIFGNSRTMSFQKKYMAATYPDWILFNFSVPGGNSDYFYYFMERFQSRSIKPDYFFFAVTPQGYNGAPSLQMDEVLLNGLSLSFILRNITHFTPDQLSNYASKKLFWNYQYRPKLSVIMKKMKHNQAHYKGFHKLRVDTHKILTENHGSAPYQAAGTDNPPQDPEYLLKSALGTWNTFFSAFEPWEDMFYFTEGYLKIAKDMGVPTKLLWAKVGGDLRRMKNTNPITLKDGSISTVRKLWSKRIIPLGKKYDAGFLDMNYGPTIVCDKYYDSSHLAAICYNEFTDYLVRATEL